MFAIVEIFEYTELLWALAELFGFTICGRVEPTWWPSPKLPVFGEPLWPLNGFTELC